MIKKVFPLLVMGFGAHEFGKKANKGKKMKKGLEGDKGNLTDADKKIANSDSKKMKLLKATLKKQKSLHKENLGKGLAKEMKKEKKEKGDGAAYKKYRK